MLEYVPKLNPTRIAKAKLNSTGPPMNTNIRIEMIAVKDVVTVRVSTSLSDWFTTSRSGIRLYFSRFSRIRP